ncbi:MAG: hypothetical protein ACRDJJ_07145 [Actinomycetota bacterium]
MSERRRPRLEVVSIDGNPTDDERRAIAEAVTERAERERAAVSTSVWLRAARGEARRLGMYDYRDRFSSDDVWRLSVRFPAGGREFPGLNGRGDAK